MNVTFEQGKKKREELRLPIQHFVVVDDWLGKLGNNAYLTWLRFYTWADRSSSEREVDVIPLSMKAIAKRLGCSEATLYKTIIRPLWNYGLIDIRELMIKKVKVKNIIVYEYPQNDPALSTKPLIQVRDYDKDYTSASRVGGIKGGKQTGLKKLKPPASKNSSHWLQKNEANNEVNNSSNSLNNSSNEWNKDNLSIRLPDSIMAAIQRNGLMDRLTEIAMTHEIFQDQPGYSAPLLIMTLGREGVRKKISAPPAVFYQYLLTALHNNINQISQPKRAANPQSEPLVPRDKLPASVVKQFERDQQRGSRKERATDTDSSGKTIQEIPDLKHLLEQVRKRGGSHRKLNVELDDPISESRHGGDLDDRPY